MIDEYMKCYECGSVLFRVIKKDEIKKKIQFHEKTCSKYNKDYEKYKVPFIKGYVKEK